MWGFGSKEYKLHEKRSHIHSYVGEGMEEWEMKQAMRDVDGVAQMYTELGMSNLEHEWTSNWRVSHRLRLRSAHKQIEYDHI